MTEKNGRVALVSGGNRGIGLEICRQLADREITVILGSRDEESGRVAAEGLSGNVVVHQLDVAYEESVDRLAPFVEKEFGRLDILVNNAGISNDNGQRGANADLDLVREALEANLFGAWRLCEMVIPLMQRQGYGRIVNVSSGMGALEDMGGGSPGYRISKTALNALTRILASELRGSGILVNSVCPGWVQTDMGSSRAPRPVEEGADTPVWAATLPNNGPTGGFFRDRRPIPW
jgi:NAD(P)-dependent dehydrogenase (short-subunit alcohol dehydrogenase family)